MSTGEVKAPAPPRVRLSLGVTGHRADHPLMREHADRISATVQEILDGVAAAVAAERDPFGAGALGPTRLVSLLADGADHLLAREALARGWELLSPLPFGANLNCAINAAPPSLEDARALIANGQPRDADAAARAQAIRALYEKSQLFELADDDDEIEALFLASLEQPENLELRMAFVAECSERVALGARLMIEQSDILIAIWGGVRRTFVGGTGHTLARALEFGAPVIWIDPAAPERWRILRAPEALTKRPEDDAAPDRARQLVALVREALQPAEPSRPGHGHAKSDAPTGVAALQDAQWWPQSNPLWQLYRRIEAVFGDDKTRNPWRNLRQTYERPDVIATGGGARTIDAVRALPGGDPQFANAIGARVLARFAWADGISSYLSDTYRGGMMTNFVLSSLAIVGGIAYLPFADSSSKWIFAFFEFVLLALILGITAFGQKRRWHGRWFETRRVAEYLRHAPLLLTLGAARAPGRWPRGAETSWPEWYARHALRDAGLPRLKITAPYLRDVLKTLIQPHVSQQRDYHHAKAKRLTAVHHNLDRLSEAMFLLAVVSVAIYLGLQILVWLHAFDKAALKDISKIFTFLGVLLPTFGGAIAGVRYFGDFERFAAISEVTAQKLDAVHSRIVLMLKASDGDMDYGPVADLAHAADDIVFSEVENWQAVFGGKQITVPV